MVTNDDNEMVARHSVAGWAALHRVSRRAVSRWCRAYLENGTAIPALPGSSPARIEAVRRGRRNYEIEVVYATARVAT